MHRRFAVTFSVAATAMVCTFLSCARDESQEQKASASTATGANGEALTGPAGTQSDDVLPANFAGGAQPASTFKAKTLEPCDDDSFVVCSYRVGDQTFTSKPACPDAARNDVLDQLTDRGVGITQSQANSIACIKA